ncbi:beta strand repeat-containing protein, partial [Pedobacter nanyangensis]|uniref:beta strand repeat-containing protein n=1 Tax=Pedobacter nanyangensis TaxID=1562389 RepID=UPI000DE3D180
MLRNLLKVILNLCFLFISSAAIAQLPFSMCSPTGGARADLLGAQAAYRAGGNTGSVSFTIPVGTATIMVYTSSHDSRLVWGTATTLQQQTDEDYITINAILNLKTKQSSGFLNYARHTDNSGSGTNLYGWRNVAFSAGNVSAHSLPGHDKNTSILNDVSFSVSGNTLTIQETNTDIYTSYYVEFVSADVSSLNSNGFNSKALLKNNNTISMPIPANTNIIFVSGKGTNGVSDNASDGGTEEGFSNMRFAIDVNKNLLDGFVTVVNGNANTNGGRERRSTYVINDHNITSNSSLLSSGAVTGDYTGKITTAGGGIGVYNPKIYISGNNLIIERDAGYGADFDDAYTFEFYTRVNQPTSAEFIDNETRFIAPTSTTPKNITVKIPAGSRFIYFNQTGNAINSTNTNNENSMAGYAVIDLEAKKANGFYYQQVGFNNQATRRDDNFAFKDLPLTGASARSLALASSNGIFNSSSPYYDFNFTLSADKSEITISNTMALVHDQYQLLLSLDFFGSRPDLAFNASHISFTKGAHCKEVEAHVRISNPGSGESPGSIPVSFYDGDPTVNPNAKRLLTDVITFNQSIPSLQEKDFIFKIDLSNYQNLNIPITMVLNDDGSFAPTLNQAIGTPFALENLRNQSDKRIECYYDNNKFSANINVNNCPTVNLDPDKSSGASTNNYLDYFTAGSAGTRIADTDMIIVDPENSNLQSATITLTNRPDGNAAESLFVDGTLPAGLTANYDAATGQLVILGNATQADYIAAIKMVKYKSTNPSPNLADRIINTVLNDGIESGPASITTIKILTNPRINVTGNTITIADGTTTTNTADGTNYGNIAGGSGLVNKTFVIQNIGTGIIQLTGVGNKVVIAGHPGFSVTTQPGSISLTSTATTNFVVSFDSNTYPNKGTYNASISILNDDPFTDRKNYTFEVQISINNIPTVQDFAKSGPEDQTINFTAADFTSHFTDADSPGDNLTEIEIIDLPLNGSLKLNGVAILPGQKIPLAQLGNITFTPSANWNGNTSFNWKATDGMAYAATSAKVNITITPVNDPPTVATITKTGSKNVTVPFTALDFTAKFTDIDGDAMTKIKIETLPIASEGVLMYNGTPVAVGQEIDIANISQLSFVPATNWSGSTSFNWNGFDGALYANSPAAVNITLSDTNGIPTLANITKTGPQNVTVPFNASNFTDRFFDIDGSLTKIQVLSLPANGTLLLDGLPVTANQEINYADLGKITFVPDHNWTGSTSFSWNGYDGQAYAASSANVNITITPNNPPVVSNIHKSGPEDQTISFTVADFTSKFSDIDGNSLTRIYITTLPSNGKLFLNGIEITGPTDFATADASLLTFVPNANWNGVTSFKWNGHDGTSTATTAADVNITITPVNDGPIFSQTTYTDATCEVTAKTGSITAATDVDGDVLTYTQGTAPSKGSVIINAATGAYTYTPSLGQTGSDSFTIVANDGNGGTATATVNFTITAAPSAGTLSGTQAICVVGTTTFSSTVTGGAWSTSDASIATVNATTGVVTGVAAGTATITYTVAGSGGCADATATRTVNVTTPPSAGTLSGTQAICVAGTTTFSSTVTGGTWSTSDASIATVNATTGVVTGVAAGTATITYTVAGSGGCANATATRTVNVTTPPSAGTLSGTQAICVAGTTTFSSTVTGGAWSTSDASIATVNATTGVVTGVAAGTATITYTVAGSGGCADATATRTVNVTTPPSAGTLSGTQAICVAGTTTFSSTVTGGTWSTSDASIATVNATTGVVTGVAAGTATITYTVAGSGGCADATATRTVNVTTPPSAGTLSGTQAICVAGTTTFSSTVTGGAWSTSDASIATVNATTGVVTGVAAGTATITYTVAGSGGCADATATRTVNVTTPPSAGTLAGVQITPVGSTTTFTSTVTGGTWSTNDANIATVNTTTGVITGVSAGTTTINYTVTGSGGCANAIVSRTITVYTAAINLTKKANNAALVTKAGDVINYSIEVENTGTSTLTNIIVTDAGADPGSINPTSIATLAAGAKTTVTAQHTLTQTEVDAGSFSNQASAKGKDPLGNDVEDEKSDDPSTSTPNDPTIVTITSAPKITLVKSGVLSSDGNTISYSFLITNTGNVTLNNIVLTDTKLGLNRTLTGISLAPGANRTETATYTLTQADKDAGKVTNSADVNAKDPSAANVTDKSGTTGTNDTPTETAVPANPKITLVKSGVLSSDGNTISYSFLITNTGNVTLNNIVLTDTKLGLNRTLTGISLAPGANRTETATYTLTQADKDAGKVTNSADVNAKDPSAANVTDKSGTTG